MIYPYFDSIRKENILNYFNHRDIQLFISSTSDLGIKSKKFFIEKGDIYDGDKEC